MTPILRFRAKPVPGIRFRWYVWDEARDRPHDFYKYKSVHKANKAADKLNGMSTRAGKSYRYAKTGDYASA